MTYRYNAVLDTEFTGGTLAGLRLERRIAYPTQREAEAAVRRSVGRQTTGNGSPYAVLAGYVELAA